MQSELMLNREHYPDNNTKIYYAKNCCGGKALEHLQPHLLVDSLIPFETIGELFTKLEEFYWDPHCKDHAIEKFGELKMGSGSFNAFYSEFFKLAANLEYIKEMLLQEFIHKWSPQMQDGMNSGLEYSDNIKDLAARSPKIYNQIIATVQDRSNTNSANRKMAYTPTIFVSLSQTSSTTTNGYCLRPENTFSPLTNKE